jgi:hypothetical protein
MTSLPKERDDKNMIVSEHTISKSNLVLTSWIWLNKPETSETEAASSPLQSIQPAIERSFDLLQPIRRWIDRIEVRNPELARSVCKLIPSQCPFERDIRILGRTVLHIPPLCKLNPVYDEIVGLRFRALCYLADECGEDVTPYC